MQLFLIIVLLLGGTSVAAERALPGDALYSMKIGVNEQVADFFSVGAKADANWHARASERRLEEAEQLAAEGKLSADIQVRIEENFKRHADRVEERIAEFKARSDSEAEADLASKFETSLRAHEAVLAKISGENAASAGALGSFRSEIRSRADRVSHEESTVNSNASINADSKADSSIKMDDGVIDVTGASGIRIDIGGSNERSTGGACTPPAPSSYGKSACCDTSTGQWYFAPAGCTAGSAI